MPLKLVKKDTAGALTLEWVLHVKNYRLSLDRNRCVGCQICSLACPKEAVSVSKQPKIQGEKAKKAMVDVDMAKCNFCGICDVVCPYGAVNLTVDGKRILSVVEKESFPQLIRDIEVDAHKFPLDCRESEEVCPLKLIKTTCLTSDGKAVESLGSLSDSEKQGLKVNVEVKKENCPCCGICEVKLSPGAMRVKKFLSGKLVIYSERCPQGCTDCLDVCPISGALYLSSEDNRVHANEVYCVYCGACKVVCPVDDALELKRTHMSHTPVRSGAWNKALERLTSPTEMAKELKAKRSLRARDSVKKRMGLRGEQYA
jgi:4Fe-4S ferredoxin